MHFWAIDIFRKPWREVHNSLQTASLVRSAPKVSNDDIGTDYEFFADGIEIGVDEDGRVGVIFLRIEGHENFTDYAGPMPERIQRGFKREDVRRELGEPACVVEAATVMVLGPQPASDIYVFGDAAVNFEYGAPGERLSEVSVYSKSEAGL